MSHKVAILAGGATHERDVSLRSGRRVATVVKELGYEVKIFDVNAGLLTALGDFAPDVVWPLVHGSVGEDGSLQDLLQLAGYRFVGTPGPGCRLATAKPVAKSVVEKNGLATPRSVALPTQLFRQLGAAQILRHVNDLLGFPVVVKPASGGSALGLSLVDSPKQLANAMVDAFAYDESVLIERFVAGAEVAVSIVERDGVAVALPPVEIEVADGSYDYDARYFAGRGEFFVPARLSSEVSARACDFALACHRVLELEQLSRIDLIVDAAGQPWFIDANVVPGMTDMSLFPLAAQAGPGFATVCQELITATLD